MAVLPPYSVDTPAGNSNANASNANNSARPAARSRQRAMPNMEAHGMGDIRDDVDNTVTDPLGACGGGTESGSNEGRNNGEETKRPLGDGEVVEADLNRDLMDSSSQLQNRDNESRERSDSP